MNAYTIQQYFDYKDGELYWKIDSAKNVKAGDIAGNIQPNGRKRLRFNKKDYLVHRLVFLYHHGYAPKILDHIDGNPLNNKIENLREANIVQNGQNRKLNKNTATGMKNVSKCGSKYRVQLNVNGESKCFGLFDDIELAGLVAVEARNKYHKEFANHG